jgi:hypothetical protein
VLGATLPQWNGGWTLHGTFWLRIGIGTCDGLLLFAHEAE